MKLTLRKTDNPPGVDPHRWDALGRYNAEVGRGIVHTDEWKAKMAAEQVRFDNTMRYRSKWFA